MAKEKVKMAKEKVKMLTVREVSEKTGIAPSTVSLYCRTKRFPHAKKKATQFGDFWMVPETDLSLVEKRKPGRPTKIEK